MRLRPCAGVGGVAGAASGHAEQVWAWSDHVADLVLCQVYHLEARCVVHRTNERRKARVAEVIPSEVQALHRGWRELPMRDYENDCAAVRTSAHPHATAPMPNRSCLL